MCPYIRGCTFHHHLQSLMDSWLLWCAYACNRCSRRSHSSGIRARTSRGVAASLGAGSSGGRRSQRRRSPWVSWPPTFLFLERQAPEHYKPLMFLQISLASFMIDALGYKSWLEPLVAYIILVQINISWILGRSKIELMLTLLSLVELRWFPVTWNI